MAKNKPPRLRRRDSPPSEGTEIDPGPVVGGLFDTPLAAVGLGLAGQARSSGIELRLSVDPSSVPGLSQQLAAAFIGGRRELIEADGRALLEAVGVLLTNRLPAPRWLADAFHARWGRLERFEAVGLDDAFGTKPLNERTRKTKQQDRTLRRKVHAAVIEEVAADPSRPIEGFLFERVGERLGIGKTKCWELYSSAVLELGLQDARELREFYKRWLDAKER